MKSRCLSLDMLDLADTPLRDAFNSPDALGTVPGPEGTSIECCTHTLTHSTITWVKIASGEERIDSWSLINPLEGQSRGAPASSQSVTAPAAPLYLPLLWHFHTDDRLGRAGRRPGLAENSLLTSVTSNLHSPDSDVLTLQLTSRSHRAGASP